MKKRVVAKLSAALILVPNFAASQPLSQLPFIAELSKPERLRAECVGIAADGAEVEACVVRFVEECVGTGIDNARSPQLLLCYKQEWEGWTGLRNTLSARLPAGWRETVRAGGTDSAETAFVLQVMDDDEQLQALTEICREANPALAAYEQCAHETALSVAYRLALHLSLAEGAQ